jgi:hypothetical protein
MTGPFIRTSIAFSSVDAGTFSAALFTQLDLENARRDELAERKAALESKVETARAKDASLHNVAVIHLYWRYLATWLVGCRHLRE